MPVIEATLIKGYDEAAKQRLISAFTRGALSVMAADPAAVIVILREVEPQNWARGGVTRTPGPPLPDAVEVVKAAATRAYSAFHEAFTDDGTLVFAEGVGADGKGFIDRYKVRGGRVVEVAAFGG